MVVGIRIARSKRQDRVENTEDQRIVFDRRPKGLRNGMYVGSECRGEEVIPASKYLNCPLLDMEFLRTLGRAEGDVLALVAWRSETANLKESSTYYISSSILQYLVGYTTDWYAQL